MKVILLAAGRGSRLGERTRERPKCMCALAGKTLLERCLETLEKSGIERAQIGIVTGYRRELIRAEGITLFHNPNWEETNMFVSLTMAGDWLEQEPCIICYSDIVFAPAVIRRLTACSAPLTLPYYTGFWDLWSRRMEHPLDDLESFRVDGDGGLLEIGRRPGSRDDIQGQFMGIIRFTPESWGQALETIRHPLPKPVSKLDMTTLLDCMLRRGCRIEAIPTQELWLECDTQRDIEIYERDFGDALAGWGD